MLGAAATNSLRTSRPSGPVCRVTSTLLSIALALAKPSGTVLQSFTPPRKPLLNVPLPRPPAWIWDLTATRLAPPAKSFSAICRAASGVSQTSPAGTATPYWSRSCLAWYSWRFMFGTLLVAGLSFSIHRRRRAGARSLEFLDSRPAGDGENRREQIGRNAQRIIDRGRIEIDVGMKVFLGEHDFGDPFAHLNPFRVAELGAEDLGHAFEVRRAGVKHLVDAMADPHDLLFLGEAILHVGIDVVERADFQEHFDHAFVGAAVERPFERADGRGDGRIHVAERRDCDAGAEGRGVHAVVRVQHVTQVDGALLFGRRRLAIHHVEKIRGLAERRVGGNKLPPLAGAVKVSGADGDLRDQSDRLAPLRVHGIVVAGGVEASQRGHRRAEGVHWRRALGKQLEHVDDALGQLARFG